MSVSTAAVQTFVSQGGSVNYMQGKMGNKIVYKPVVNGYPVGEFKTFESGQSAAAKYIVGNLPSNAALQGELFGAMSMLKGKPTLFVDDSTFGMVVDQMTFNPGSTDAVVTMPKVDDFWDQTVSGILISGVLWLLDWLLGKIFKTSYSLYINGYLLAVVATEQVPAIFRAYRQKGLHIQIVKNEPNKGARASPKPRHREHMDEFYRPPFYWT